MRKLIEFKNIVKSFNDSLVLKGINLSIHENEFVTLLGPSGCGKTTLLRILGGFISQNEGHVYFDDIEISNVPPYKREINTVFQRYALFPHMNVFDNIAFGLRIKKQDKNTIEQKVNKMLKLVNLEGYGDRPVTLLSGGQQQRVALARCVAQQPKIILADEPVASLDPVTSNQVMNDFVKINKALNITVIANMHHVDIALKFANRVIGIKEGLIVFDGPSSKVNNQILKEIYGRELSDDELMEH